MTDTVTLTFRADEDDDQSVQTEVPREIGNLHLIEEIGHGGMGVVWRGHDQFLNREVAVKWMRDATMSADPVLKRQFIDGARAAAVVKHPNVVSVYHADECQGMLYIVMEYVDGDTLRDLIKHQSEMDQEIAAVIMAKILDALAAIHKADVIHRDMKPSNVLFDQDGHLLVTDFGLSLQRDSALTDEQAVCGTPPYMAPEMFEGDASFQSDIYAASIIYYELLTGERPFQAEDVDAYRFMHTNCNLPVDSLDHRQVDENVRELLLRSTHKRKIFRYKSAAKMLQTLSEVYPRILHNDVLDRRLRDLILEGRKSSRDGEAKRDADESPAGTYFDLISQRADAKRKRKSDLDP